MLPTIDGRQTDKQSDLFSVSQSWCKLTDEMIRERLTQQPVTECWVRSNTTTTTHYLTEFNKGRDWLSDGPAQPPRTRKTCPIYLRRDNISTKLFPCRRTILVQSSDWLGLSWRTLWRRTTIQSPPATPCFPLRLHQLSHHHLHPFTPQTRRTFPPSP